MREWAQDEVAPRAQVGPGGGREQGRAEAAATAGVSTHILQKPEDQVLRTRRTGGRHGSAAVSVRGETSCQRVVRRGQSAECGQLTIGCVMIFWTLDAMALRGEA